jgi:hypothetical protein
MMVGPTLVFLCLVFGPASETTASDCPAPAGRPVGLSQSAQPVTPPTLEPYSITRTVPHYYDAPLGKGFLEVAEGINKNYYDWMFVLELPLWRIADASRPLGWLTGGQIHTESGTEALTGFGMVETAYEHTSFIVWEARKGWLKLRLTDRLYAWTHQCHLKTTKFRLDFVPWSRFLTRHADWLHFRKPVPHKLRSSPEVGSAPVTTIGLDHKLVLLEVRGDWMKVKVEQPDVTCSGPRPGKIKPIRHSGWVKWRDDKGPWVFIYTRGC